MQLALKLKIPDKHRPDLERARMIAELYAADGRIVSMDDVRELFEKQYARPLAIGNTTGAVFKYEKWAHVGYCKSRSPKAKARVIQTWQLIAFTPSLRVSQNVVGTVNGEKICLKCSRPDHTGECVTQ